MDNKACTFWETAGSCESVHPCGKPAAYHSLKVPSAYRCEEHAPIVVVMERWEVVGNE